MLKKSDLIIFDEATSALDSETEHAVQSSWKKLFSDKTAIIIAHRFGTIREVDRILVLKQGKLIAFDTHEHLVKYCDYYNNLFKKQYLLMEEEE